MNREEALTLLREHVKNENMIKHCLASEAVLRALAVRLGQDPDKWALAAGETITGLKYKRFAASVNRDTIRECGELGLTLDQFVGLSLDAMKGVSGELGL